MSLLSESDWKPHCRTTEIAVTDNMGRVPDVKISQSALHTESGGTWPDNSQRTQQYHALSTRHTWRARDSQIDMAVIINNSSPH